uniref:sensor histidine kinase n=1 Tax=Pedobacter schmidteae TaxID=2201271 RepID=UPI0013CF24D2|nr:ATP-binding protein [Pedobacter schmidteae]
MTRLNNSLQPKSLRVAAVNRLIKELKLQNKELEVQNKKLTEQMNEEKLRFQKYIHQLVGIIIPLPQLIENSRNFDFRSENLIDIAIGRANYAIAYGQDHLVAEKFERNEIQAIKLETINIAESLRLLISEFSPYAMSMNKKINIHVNEDSHFRVVTDKEMLGDIVNNLLNNAIEHSKDGHCIDITVNRHEFGSVAIEIKNKGHIYEETLKTMFEPYFSMGKRKSFGLGLYVCKQYAELLNIKFNVCNDNGHVKSELIFG